MTGNVVAQDILAQYYVNGNGIAQDNYDGQS